VKRRAEMDPPFHMTCPFCGFATTWMSEMRWCGDCFVEWYPTRDGTGYIFDTLRKTPRFALAKAIGKAGGVRFGRGR
jgi:hypothetical protein